MQTHRIVIEITSSASSNDVADWVADCISRNTELSEEWDMDMQDAPLNERHVLAITNRMVELARTATRYSEVA